MIRFLLGVALAAACSSPALAALGKAQPNHAYTYPTPSWVLPLPRSERLANALGGWNRGYPADPYWNPCLSYQRNWGVGCLRRALISHSTPLSRLMDGRPCTFSTGPCTSA
jgi:hypothetical protein